VTRCRGFTLIEILVVLVVLGLALSVVTGFVPRRVPVLDLRSATDALVNTLRTARARAIATQQTTGVTLLPAGAGYALDGVPHALPPTVRAAMVGAAIIRFSADGSSSGGEIRLVDGTHARILKVDWPTGRVSVRDAG
jgi:general secretion pathway protein H